MSGSPPPGFDVELVDDAEALRARAGALLAAEPIAYNVIATLAEGATPDDAIWAVVRAPGSAVGGGAVVGVVMHTPPHGAALGPMPAGAPSAAAGALHAAGRRLPGASGDRVAVDEFARRWAELAAVAAHPTRQLATFTCASVRQPAGVPGQLRPATGADSGVVGAWAQAFAVEVGLGAEHVAAAAEHLLAKPGVYVWDDLGAASLVAHNVPAAGVVRVGPVYTPPELRGRGYAAAATAAVTRLILGGGSRPMLFTDLANPTSNSVYQRIGYERVGDAAEVEFGAEGVSAR